MGRLHGASFCLWVQMTVRTDYITLLPPPRRRTAAALLVTPHLLVAAMQMTTLSLSVSNPSSSVSSWLSVCSRSSLPTERRRLSRPLATCVLFHQWVGATVRAGG
jgi:hypothetical protein